MKFLPSLLAASAIAGLALPASAQNATTTPVGAVTVTIKKNSDSIFSVPLGTQQLFRGTVGSIAGAGSNLYSISPSGNSPSWTENQFQDLFFIRFSSGSRSGMYYTIASNSASQLTVNSAGDDLGPVAQGDEFIIYKHWTLNTLFPYDDPVLNPLTASTGTLASARRSQIQIYDSAVTGVNIAPGSSYYFTNAGWLKAGTNAPSNDVVIPPDACFCIRQPSTIASDVQWTVTGTVISDPLSVPVPTLTTGSQEHRFGLMRPMDVKLSESGFESGFVSSTSLLASGRKDTLYVFDNSVAGFNKAPSKVFFRYGSDWRQAISGSPIANDEIIKPSDGIMIRKALTVGGYSAILTNQPNFTIN